MSAEALLLVVGLGLIVGRAEDSGVLIVLLGLMAALIGYDFLERITWR